MRWIVLMALFISCSEPRVYECSGWEKRMCLCPSGEEGEQKCSSGPAFNDPPPPREWLFCSCCFDTKRDDHGIYYINQRDVSGCWDDVYDPSVNSLLDVESEE